MCIYIYCWWIGKGTWRWKGLDAEKEEEREIERGCREKEETIINAKWKGVAGEKSHGQIQMDWEVRSTESDVELKTYDIWGEREKHKNREKKHNNIDGMHVM